MSYQVESESLAREVRNAKKDVRMQGGKPHPGFALRDSPQDGLVLVVTYTDKTGLDAAFNVLL